MGQIIIAKHFQKELDKIKIVNINNVVKEIKKYNNGLDNLIDLYSIEKDMKILKGYLRSGNIRFAVLLILNQNNFIPCLIVKKESKDGLNLSKKNSAKKINQKIELIMEDISNNNCFEVNL